MTRAAIVALTLLLGACDDTTVGELADAESATTIQEFDGFPWGATKADIIRVRGRPIAEENVPGVYYAAWDAFETETISGYPLKEIVYWFKDECAEPEVPCYLWHGSYELAEVSTSAVETLSSSLHAKYGEFIDHARSSTATPAIGMEGDDLPQQTYTYRTWRLDDNSEVALVWSEYDRGFQDSLGRQHAAGIASLTLNYASSEYMTFLERTDAIINVDKAL